MNISSKLFTTRSALFAAVVCSFGALSPTASADEHAKILRAAVPERAIEHVLVIDMENEDFAATFGANSPAVYLNQTLLKQGELIPNYFATSHVSLGNYISQISGRLRRGSRSEAVRRGCVQSRNGTTQRL